MTVSPIPLPGMTQPEAPIDSPELLLINAFLHDEVWDPGAHGVRAEMLSSYSQAWQFCQDHVDQTGHPPTVEVFARHFPSVELLEGVEAAWAAHRLKTKHYERTMRSTLQDSIRALNDGDLPLARATLLQVTKPTSISAAVGMTPYDLASVDEASVRAGWAVPWSTMQQATNGFGRGEFWVLGARLGQGKSALATAYATSFAQHGARVGILSCEMPKRSYTKRIHTTLAAGDSDLQKALRSPDITVRQAALAGLPRIPGSMETFDPSDLRMTTRAIEEAAARFDVVVLDHFGLFSDDTGKRAIEDYRIAAAISNRCKEISLEQNMTVFALSQINREGEGASMAPPKVSQLSQTDALGQDADGVIVLRRMGERTMLHQLAKNREGPNVRWYSEFEPAKAGYAELTKDQALDRMREDEDRTADH